MNKLEPQSTKCRIAYFVSPHGFGHAARAAAVMAAIRELVPSTHFEIFTKVPTWFFESSLDGGFNYHSLLTDIGLVQKNSLTEDVPETLRRLDALMPFDPTQIKNLAELVNQLGCQMVMCDIAPMGLVVAKEARLSGILVENFTWDWIYQGYLPYEQRLGPHIAYLQDVFAAADYHIQTEPLCVPREEVDLTTVPISRKTRTPAKQIRQKLRIPDQAKMVLVTMGGTHWHYTFLERLEREHNVYFVVSGSGEQIEFRGNLVLLPAYSEFFHPDLVNACDAIIGKIGYSIMAEAYHAGVPFGHIARPKFRESQALAGFIEEQMNGLHITEAQFQNGDWLSLLPNLLTLPRIQRHSPNGADQVAGFVEGVLNGTFI
ncbi:glycosyltransferase family protein [Chloroflexota bacterium]